MSSKVFSYQWKKSNNEKSPENIKYKLLQILLWYYSFYLLLFNDHLFTFIIKTIQLKWTKYQRLVALVKTWANCYSDTV